jgi:pilus assembly protein CpaE
MNTYVVSDNEAVSAKIREVLLKGGHDCPDSHVVPLGAGPSIVGQSELTVVVMSPDPERGLVALREMATALGGISLRSAQAKRFLAVGPADARLILRTIREGAEEYIDETEVSTELDTVLVRIMSEGLPGGEPGQVISILAPSGGSGSSTLACNLATVLAKEHNQAMLFDLKLGAGVCDAMLDLKPQHTLTDLCRNAERMDRGMFERMLIRHASGVRLLPPPVTFDDMAEITGMGVRQALTMARGIFPYVVIDLDRTYGEEQVEVLQQSDIVMLILRLDFTSLRNTRQTLDHLERLGIMRDRIRLVVNRYGQPKEMRMAQAEEALGLKVFGYIPDDPKTVNRANNNGVPVVLDSPTARVARSIIELAHSINGQAKG